MKSTEKETQKAILEYLELKKIFHWRQNSGAFKVRNRFYRFASINGIPDIMAFHKGIAYGVEVKDKYGKQSPAQKEFQKQFEKSGGKYILAKSLDDITTIL